MNNGVMIVAEGLEYSLDCYETQLNNNVMVVGASGAGKTTRIVIPNIMQANGSYIVTDPKGNLYRKIGPYLEKNGYEVMSLDLAEPSDEVRYNFIDYIQTEQDVIKVAHMLMTGDGSEGWKGHNAFFYNTGELYVAAAIATLKFVEDVPFTFNSIFSFCRNIILGEKNNTESDTESWEAEYKWWSLSKRLLNTVCNMSDETGHSVFSTIGSVLGRLNTKGVEEMMTSEEYPLDIKSIGKKKTALFVKVSDTDRSLDTLVDIFFTQAMEVLCHYADTECENETLPVPVQFIMDDFATNCTIEGFPRMISSIRSRNISTMIMLQAESQLEKKYDKDWTTVISNCDTYIYMGGNDLRTAESIAKRADLPVKKILYMPVGTNWVFRRGQAPINGENYNCRKHIPELFDQDIIRPKENPDKRIRARL